MMKNEKGEMVMIGEDLFFEKEKETVYIDPIADKQMKEQSTFFFFNDVRNFIFFLIPIFSPIGTVLLYGCCSFILSACAMKIPVVVKILLGIAAGIYTFVLLFILILFVGCVVLEV